MLKLFVSASSFLLIAAAAIILPSAHAGVASSIGYANRTIYESDPFAFIGGLDVLNNRAYFGVTTNVIELNLSTESPFVKGTLPSPNTGASYIRMRDGNLHIAYAENFAFPPPYRYGLLDNLGNFEDHGGLAGIYDAAVDSSGNMFIMAYPTFAGSVVYRYNPVTTSLTEIIFVGGPSGGIAFDSQDRLYVAEQTTGQIIRYTQAQLSIGNLTAGDGDPVVTASASYICFDHHDRLYAVTGYGNQLSVYDVENGYRVREIALDDSFGYGIGWIGWDKVHHALLVVYTDYFVASASSLHAVTFAPSHLGIPGTSTVFRGWIAAYQDFTRPITNSGGYARNNSSQPTTPGTAIIGKPAAFDSADGTSHVLSLGNGGSITLTFDDIIFNGPGPDFAVFENGFDAMGGTFAELAFVEVATTTNAWAKFPVTVYGTNTIGPFEVQDVKLIDGLAGKTTLPIGVPFDLEWLQNDPNVLNGSVDLNRIAYIRITDVIGNGSTTDQFGNPIYDPYDSVFISMTDGFDLRAIGAIHLAGINMNSDNDGLAMEWYGYPGRNYQPQYMFHGDWFDLGAPIVGTGGIHRVTMNGDESFRLIRIQQDIPFTP